MSSELHINGRVFQTVRLAAREVSYSKDYITRLARERKVQAVHIARNWYIDVAALKNYEETLTLDTGARNRQLKLQRQQELQVRQRLLQHSTTDVQKKFILLVYSCAAVLAVIASGYLTALQVSPLLSVASVGDGVELHSVNVSDTTETPLQPVFVSESESVVYVDGVRSISHPEVGNSWQSIVYE